MEDFRHSLDEILATVDKIEKQVNEVEQFYQSTSNIQTSGNAKGSSLIKDKGREKHFISTEKLQQDASCREAAAAKRMQELMRQFSTIFRQHKWAWPFLEPVDVKGLQLHDYYEVIEKPMDFSTIKRKMEAKDGTGYKNVREIYADVRLVFKNAMKYNDEKNEYHVMAKSLLERFEEKWLQLLPKVAEEEKRLQEDELEAQLDMQLAREAAYANMARDLSSELFEVDNNLKILKEMVIQKCRKLTSEEKRILGTAIAQLSPENISRALEIVAENNPNFQATAREVDLDIDAQTVKLQGTNSTLQDESHTMPDDAMMASLATYVDEVFARCTGDVGCGGIFTDFNGDCIEAFRATGKQTHEFGYPKINHFLKSNSYLKSFRLSL
ncbi:transcription factor GTE6-like isoform X2 [Prosopis cineraria]|uniref:transcription factor GTE6-like isoform X2 n=1 Tax=Prosopis cineraria TaxID=364024 RepID=UPI00240F6C64|nr:transcription factor GTE6-like isoform X2 [Prosopis cineraria]